MGDGKTPLRDLVWLLPAMAVALHCVFIAPLLQLGALQGQIPRDAISAADYSADDVPTASWNTHREPRQEVSGLVSYEGTITAKGAIGRALISAKLAQRQSMRQLADEVQNARLDKRAQVIKGLIVDGAAIGVKLRRLLVSYEPPFERRIEYINQNPIMISGCEIIALTVVLHSMGFEDAEPKDIADNYLEKGSDSKTHYTGTPYGIGGGFAPCIVKAANKWLAHNVGGSKLKKKAASENKASGSSSANDEAKIRAGEKKGDERDGESGKATDASGKANRDIDKPVGGNSSSEIDAAAIPQAYDLTGSSFISVCELVKLGYPVLMWTTDGMVEPSVSSNWYDPEHCVVVYGVKGDDVLVSDSLSGLVKRDAGKFGDIYEKCGKRAAFVAPAFDVSSSR